MESPRSNVAETTEWKCDTCRQPISDISEGWLEWKVPYSNSGSSSEEHRSDFKIVHCTPRCQCDETAAHKGGMIVGHGHLQEYVGPDGLMRLLEFLSDERDDTTVILEIVKRLHIPGYEKARLHFRRAISEGVFEPNRKTGFYWMRDIEATLDFADSEGADS